MHPNPRFHTKDRALIEAMIAEIGFGMVFATTPDGPRVAHTPLLSDGNGTIRFHLARSNALSAHLAGATALFVVNGPDGYISPRWYVDRDTVPTWNYVAIEMEGSVSPLSEDALEAFLHALIETHEASLGGMPWRASEAGAEMWAGLRRGIVGFEMEVVHWRSTFKLSQNKGDAERSTIAAGLHEAGGAALAHWTARQPV